MGGSSEEAEGAAGVFRRGLRQTSQVPVTINAANEQQLVDQLGSASAGGNLTTLLRQAGQLPLPPPPLGGGIQPAFLSVLALIGLDWLIGRGFAEEHSGQNLATRLCCADELLHLLPPSVRCVPVGPP